MKEKVNAALMQCVARSQVCGEGRITNSVLPLAAGFQAVNENVFSDLEMYENIKIMLMQGWHIKIQSVT